MSSTVNDSYVLELAKALCSAGHNLIAISPNISPDLDFVSSFIRETSTKTRELMLEKSTNYRGSCMGYKPYLSELLTDSEREGNLSTEAMLFTGLANHQLEAYAKMYRSSLCGLLEKFVPEAVLVDHSAMLPYIIRPVAEDAGIPYLVTIHGSAIEFAVNKDARDLHQGASGLEGASLVVVPSEHSGEVVLEVFGGLVPGLEEKIRFVPFGVDTALFAPARESFAESVEKLIGVVEPRAQGVAVGDFLGDFPGDVCAEDNGYLEHEISRINAMHPDWLPEPDFAERLRDIARGDRPVLMFIGKLLETKGIQCVLPAIPLVLEHHPAACLLVVGFGELWGLLEMMLEAIDTADVRALKVLCEYGNRQYSGLTTSPFTPVLDFLETLVGEGMMDEYLRLCMSVDVLGSVVFTGYLKPEEHCHILPHARALLVPSLAPEAFGLVVTEAMAAGVPPIACTHSGLATAMAPCEKAWGDQAELFELSIGQKMVFRIAAASQTILDMPLYTLREKGTRMRALVGEAFSWEAVGRDMVALFEEASLSQEDDDVR